MVGRRTVTATGDTSPFHAEFQRRGWTWDGAERTWWILRRHYSGEMRAWLVSLPRVKIGHGMRVFDDGMNM